MSPWGNALVGDGPGWPSPVGDDGTPFEFSLSLGTAPELRMLVEPLGSPPSLHTNRATALALLTSLSRDFDLDLDRLECLRDLFLPDASLGAFAPCLAVGFSALGPPQFKLYLDPATHGKHLVHAVVDEAFVRLGLGSCWPVLAGAMRRGPDLDELAYFSLDLSRGPSARVKVYVRHHHGTPGDLESAASAGSFYRPGTVLRFVEVMAPDCQLAFERRTPLTCLAFVPGADGVVTAATTHIPINSYAPDDATIERRVRSYLVELGRDANTYVRALRAYANRSLQGTIGAQSYVSLQAGPNPRLTVYLAAEAYRPGTIASANTRAIDHDLTRLIDRFERREPITDHPFLRRLRREPVDLGHLWRMLANFQISISANFARWLAGIVARVDDDRIRCILADQLNDELGRGTFERAHVQLFARMMDVLAPFGRSVDDDPVVLAAGRSLEPRLAAIYGAPDVFEAVGAVLAGEIFGKQVDQLLGDEFRRQTLIAPESLAWLSLHETLEVAHADASSALAALVPPHAVKAAHRGAMAVFLAGWTFLDQLYATCYATG
jgi:DMATS type aromatic prenyltransferase